MKRFIDPQAIFEMKVPSTFKYSTDGKVHTFQDYKIWRPDAFQVSIRPINQVIIDKYKEKHATFEIVQIGEHEIYIHPDNIDEDFTLKCWTGIINNQLVIFTLNYANEQDEELDPMSVSEKVDRVLSSINSFKIIDPSVSAATINWFRFEMFLHGVGATSLILSKAVENKSFIEATCLIASQIDALLRVGIVLKLQILDSNSEIKTEWIYQGPTDPKKSEKDIYKKAQDLGIIDSSLNTELYKLYDDRNRVIHRFIISEITLAEIKGISYEYYKMANRIIKIVYDIEAEQITLGVGMTTSGDGSTGVSPYELIKGKIGIEDYHKTDSE
jgi:hypothetical protein